MMFYMFFSRFFACTKSIVGETPCEELCLELVNQCGFQHIQTIHLA